MKSYTDIRSEELLELRETDMPFRFLKFDYSDGFAGFQFHWHTEIEIHYIVKGHGTFFIEDKEYEVNEGDIVYISPKLIHSGKSVNNDMLDFCYIIDSSYMLSLSNENLTDRFISELLSTRIRKPIIHEYDNGYDNIVGILDNIDSCAERNEIICQLEIKKFLYDFFIELYKNKHLILNSSNNAIKGTPIIKKAIRYIQNNMTSKLNIEEIASHVGLSPTYFMKLFKQSTKMTCVEYINTLRLDKATTLLLETTESILEIAHNCGYSNLSLFNRDFKKAFEITPSQYRKKFSTFI